MCEDGTVGKCGGIIGAFEPIGLEEMNEVALFDRTDTKYMFHEDRLNDVLTALLPHYRLLTIDGVRGTDYRSLYFDTEDLRLYRDHHNGRTFRCKVRFREYGNSGLCFLEVKRKNGRGDTNKKRVKAGSIPGLLDGEQDRFVQYVSGGMGQLRPVLWNHYQRFTLVAKDRPERLTIDLALRFSDDRAEQALGPLCIAEIKQARGDRGSPFTAVMRDLRQRSGGLSKYCTGLTLLRPELKHNTFNAALRSLHRVLQPY
jgi:VTC domain